MVSQSFWRKLIKMFFVKDIFEFVVMVWHYVFKGLQVFLLVFFDG